MRVGLLAQKQLSGQDAGHSTGSAGFKYRRSKPEVESPLVLLMHGEGPTESHEQRHNRYRLLHWISFIWKQVAIAMILGGLTQRLREDVN
jgi:hypothetical protein